MIILSRLFAASSSGPTVFVAPSQLTRIFGWPITNSEVYGWGIILLIIVTFLIVARKVKLHPARGFVGLVEEGVNFIIRLVESSFSNPKVGRKYVPYFVTLFFFILFNNWSELTPLIGDAFKGGGSPLLRPWTADLNATLAMGLITMGLVYYASVKESGGLRIYLRHFFVGNPKNPLYLVIGMLEMLTDLTRVISLSLRLYLNVTIGMIVIDVFAYLGHVLAPISALPFYLIEIFICMLQAYIFTILSVMYLAVAVNHAQDHNDLAHAEEDLTGQEQTGKIGAEPAGAASSGGA
jgi:F-type H+-transporting ATPase subunit a